MKKNIIRIIFVFLIVSLTDPVFPITGDEAIAKFADRLNAETVKGNLTITYQSGEMYSGIFMYMKPGKMYIKFSDPPGKLIVTNGKRLWVYDSTSAVCGVQELETEGEAKDKGDEGLKPRLSGGILGFLHGYNAKIIESPTQKVIELTDESKKYSEVKLILTPDFMLSSVVFKNKGADGGFAVKLSDVRTGEKITPGIFNFKAPSNAQIVKNPLDIR